MILFSRQSSTILLSERDRESGRHRSAGVADLPVVAICRASGLTVLHDDRDVEVIFPVPGQPVEWVVPSGSVG